ncbi:transglutaminase family protein [Patescibacteria group bacterium]
MQIISSNRSKLLIASGLVLVCFLSACVPSRPRDTGREAVPSESSPSAIATIAPEEYGLLETTQYRVSTEMTMINEGAEPTTKLKAWLALPRDIEPYQKVISMNIDPAQYKEINDKEGNNYAEIDMPNLSPGETASINGEFIIEVNQVNLDLADCEGDIIDDYLGAEEFIESEDPEIQKIANQLTRGKNNVCEKAEVIYNYVADEMFYAGYIPEESGAAVALSTKQGDCTDFADLFIALSRASGIPARFAEGVVYNPGAVGLGEIKHDWPEVYFPGIGWAPVDPTFGQSIDMRDSQFAEADGDHIIITQGRNLEQLKNFHYFVFQYWSDNQTAAVVMQDETWEVEED